MGVSYERGPPVMSLCYVLAAQDLRGRERIGLDPQHTHSSFYSEALRHATLLGPRHALQTAIKRQFFQFLIILTINAHKMAPITR